MTIVPTDPPRPRKHLLATGFRSPQLSALQDLMAKDSQTLIQYNLDSNPPVCWSQRVTRLEAELLSRYAKVLGINVYDLWVEFHWVPNEDDDAVRIPMRFEQIVFKRIKTKGLMPENREPFFRALIEATPKGSNGCAIDDDQVTGIVTITFGKELALPDRADALATIPKRLDPMDWARIPLGVNLAGLPMGPDLSKIPHILVAGKPGSGKSTLLRTDMAQRVARGHRLAIFDPFKKAPWAVNFKPYTIAWRTEQRGVANALAFIYEEAQRRGRLIRAHGKENWYDFTLAEREELGIYPLSIFFDEFESAITTKDLRATELAFGKDSSRYVAEQKFNVAVGMIMYYTAQIGIECRYAGIFLVVATQFPYKEKLGAARNVLGYTVQLHQAGAAIQSSEIALAMGSDAPQTVDLLTEFSKSAPGTEAPRGLGVVRDAETGEVAAMRVAFLDNDDVPDLMQSLGIQPCSPWAITDELGLGIRAEEVPDTRPRVAPPVTKLTHLDDDAEETDDESVTAEPELTPARTGRLPQWDEFDQ